MEIRFSPEFEKRYRKLSLRVKKNAEKQIDIFISDTHHPSLNVEKLNPKEKDYWSLRVNKQYRIIYRYHSKDIVYFVNVGEHDWIYKYTNRL